MAFNLSSHAAIDLQIHTIYSDGLWLPEDLIAHLIKENFALVAITDHDRVDTIAHIQEITAKEGFPILPAVEMTTRWRDGIVDILCFGVNPDDKHLNTLAQNVIQRQGENSVEVFENLCRQEHLSMPKMRLRQDDWLTSLLGKPPAQHAHEFIALLEADGDDSVSPVKVLLDAGFELATNETAVVVDAVHLSSAVALIAHPGRGGEFVRFDVALLDELRREIPIDGIEAYYPYIQPRKFHYLWSMQLRIIFWSVLDQTLTVLTINRSNTRRKPAAVCWNGWVYRSFSKKGLN